MRKRFLWYVLVCVYIAIYTKTQIYEWALFLTNISGLLFMDYIVMERLTIKKRDDENE